MLCNTIRIWTTPGDGSERAVVQVAEGLVRNAARVPRSMIEFLVERESQEVILKTLWLVDTDTWESVVEGLNSKAEGLVSESLGDLNKGVRRSAARLLKTIGTAPSLPAFRRAL